MSMYDKNHHNIVISLQLIKINGEKKKICGNPPPKKKERKKERNPEKEEMKIREMHL